MNSSNRKNMILSGVAIVLLIALIIGATYAYFAAQTGDPASADIKINAYTVDTLTFASGDPITLSLDQENFSEGKGNQTGSTYASAMLTANNKTNTATDHYYMYLNISNKSFKYTINENTPEIIMTVTDSEGTELTSVEGLTHVTAQDASGASITGFDITNKEGLIKIFNGREITTTSSKEEKWNVKVTYINYDKDQSANAGNSLDANLIIVKNRLLIDYAISQYTGVQGENNLYHHDGTLENGIDDGSYRYAGADYKLSEKALNAGYTSITSTSATSTDGVIEFYCNNEKSYYGKWCESTDTYFYKLSYDSSDTQYSSYITAIEQAINDGYVESNNLNNFICFGSNETPCPIDNLYRIIGIIDGKVKLIKYDYANSNLLGTDGDYKNLIPSSDSSVSISHYKGSLASINGYSWNYKNDPNMYGGYGSKEWNTSLLNKTNLNTNFLNNIGIKWTSIIDDTTWKVSGHKSDMVTPSEMYTSEITNVFKIFGPNDGISKIGLMYASDYGFASAPSAWTTILYNYNSPSIITSVNWMYMGIDEWTLTPGMYGYSVKAFTFIGGLQESVVSNGKAIRPVFFLENLAEYASGDGSKNNPIRLKI